jgi:hypothetical protein
MKTSMGIGRPDWIGLSLCTAGVFSLFMAFQSACGDIHVVGQTPPVVATAATSAATTSVSQTEFEFRSR